MRNFLCLCLLATSLSVAGPSTAQAPPAADVGLLERTLGGEFGPPVIRYSDLPDGLKAVDLSLGGFADIEALYGPYGGISGNLRGRSIDLIQRISSYLSVYWTTGKSLEWHGAEYIVAYRADVPRPLNGYNSETPAPPPLALQTLRLRVLRMDQIATITPRADLSKSGWLAVVDDESRPRVGGDGNRTAALSNVKQVGLAALMYANDYDDYLPNAHSASQAKTLLMPYSKNSELFVTKNPNGGQLLFNVNLAGIPATVIETPATVPLFYDSKAWPDGARPVVFTDGHAKIVTADDWGPVAAELTRKYKRPPPPPPAKTGKKGKKR